MRWSEVREYIANQIYGVIRWTVSTATVDAKTRFVGREGHAVDPSDPESQWYTRLVQHYGFASSPKKGSELITASIGGEGNNGAIIAEYTPDKGPQDLNEGDVSAYGWNDGQLLRFNEAGDTELTTAAAGLKIDNLGAMTLDAASGKDIVVNGGTSPVVRISDGVNCGSLVAVVAGSPPVVSVTLSYVDPSGATIPWFSFTATAGTPGTYPIPLSGVIHPGAPHFLA